MFTVQPVTSRSGQTHSQFNLSPVDLLVRHAHSSTCHQYIFWPDRFTVQTVTSRPSGQTCLQFNLSPVDLLARHVHSSTCHQYIFWPDMLKSSTCHQCIFWPDRFTVQHVTSRPSGQTCLQFNLSPVDLLARQ
jgi:hypothetical protein